MRQFAPQPIADKMTVPMTQEMSTIFQSIDERVLSVLNTRKPNDKTATWTRGFVTYLFTEEDGTLAQLTPLTMEEACEYLSKPSQRSQIKNMLEVLDLDASPMIESFVKPEAGRKAGRMISGFADIRFIIRWSCIAIPVYEWMKKRWGDRWFDPGKTCDQIIEGVNEFVIRNNFDVVETDYTNMDGMTSEWTQLHECLAPLLKIFGVKHHQETL